jgi:hypothetical protein
MFFSTKEETILVDGKSQKFVETQSKESMVRGLNELLNSLSTAKGKYLRHKSFEINMSEESMSRAPMFCNALMSKGYKNILFVGHFNEGQTHWMLDQLAGRMIDVLPPERHEMSTFPDMNIVAQFIPIMMDAYGYDVNFSVQRPPERKHKGVMHEMYEQFELGQNLVLSSQQYKHGQDSWTIEGEHEKFDAVVFLGVPMQDQEIGFEEDQVREIFAPMCTPEFDMVDIYYGAPSSVKWFNGEEKDSKTMVDTAFSVRAQWDSEMSSGRPEEYDIMKNMIKVF